MAPAEELKKMGYQVEELSVYHFRIENAFDFWLPHGKWHDLRTGERGKKPLDQIPFFVKERLNRSVDNVR